MDENGDHCQPFLGFTMRGNEESFDCEDAARSPRITQDWTGRSLFSTPETSKHFSNSLDFGMCHGSRPTKPEILEI